MIIRKISKQLKLVALFVFVLVAQVIHKVATQVSEEAENPDETCAGPGSDPYRNFAFNGRCNCKKFVRGKFCSECKPKTFDLDHKHRYGCLRCFCSGRSNVCESSNWVRQNQFLSFNNDSEGVQLVFKNMTPVQPSPSVNPDNQELYVDDLPLDSHETYYWKLPESFLGEKLTSYGGFINFTINQKLFDNADDENVGRRSKWLKNPLMFMQGNGITLFFRFRKRDRRMTSNYLPLIENNWYKLRSRTKRASSEGRRKKKDKGKKKRRKRKRANRSELMTVLSNVNFILIKANYKTTTKRVGLMNASISDAAATGATTELAKSVENCLCPTGYSGLSCQRCASGFTKKQRSSRESTGTAIQCFPCQCNGHSQECHHESGKCLNCVHNTSGNHCEISLLNCDVRGTLQIETAPPSCKCKARVAGPLCDECKDGNFYLSSESEQGCKKCWCSGVTFRCFSSTLRRFQIRVQTQQYINIYYYNRAINGWAYRPVDINNGKATFEKKYSTFTDLYWSLPKIFTGHLLKSYGGFLNFSVTNKGHLCPERVELYPMLEMESFSGLKLWWKFKPILKLNQVNSFSVMLTEYHFVFYNTTVESPRNIFLELLSSVKHINVRVPDCPRFAAEVESIVLDTATEGGFVTENPQAIEVEACQCPYEYSGLSCEFCSYGYERDPLTKRCVRKRGYWT